MPSRDKTLAAVGTGCAILAIAAWAFYVRAFAGLHGDDWMVFYSAARATLDGKLALVYDGDWLTATINARFAHWLTHPLELHPFLYPPHYLLMLVPFGLLPPAISDAVFLCLSFAGLVAALWPFAKTSEERWLFVLAALLCPAAAITVCAGQNTFLTLSLIVGGFWLAPRRPLLAGVLFGLLTYKPQLGLMIPVALIAMRQWKVIASAAATTLCLVAASMAVFGLQPWHTWFALMASHNDLYVRWDTMTRVYRLSVASYALFFGATPQLANFVQLLSAVASGAAVYWFHRRPTPPDLRLAVVLAATMLASPHVLLYDAMTAEIAAALFFVYALRNGTPVIDTVIAVPTWLVTMANPPALFVIGAATPFLVAAFLALVLWRGTAPHGGGVRSDALLGGSAA